MPKDSGIGTSPKRREDVRFLTGNGKYTDAQGNVFEGKFKYGTFKTKIDKYLIL